MKKMIAAAVMVLGMSSVAAMAAQTTLKGTVSDEMCGAQHVKGTDKDVACVQKCVKGGSPAVLVVGDKIYKIDNQDAVKEHLGHHVIVMGELSGDTIHIDSVKM
jgi:hypothetical protein